MQALVGAHRLPAAYNARLADMKRPGSTFKLNLALERAPSFRCLPEHGPAFGPTIHLLPEEGSVLAELERGWRAVQAGKLADFPSIEWYMHSTVDDSLRDARGRISSAFFVQWVPYELAGQLLGGRGRALRAATAGDRRSLRAGDELVGQRLADHASAADRAALRHQPRAHPSHRQQLRLLRSLATPHADRGPVFGERRHATRQAR